MDQDETTLLHLFGDQDKGIECFCGIEGGSGDDAFDKKCRVLNRNGEDIGQGLTKGYRDTTALIKRNGISLMSEEDLNVPPKVFNKV